MILEIIGVFLLALVVGAAVSQFGIVLGIGLLLVMVLQMQIPSLAFDVSGFLLGYYELFPHVFLSGLLIGLGFKLVDITIVDFEQKPAWLQQEDSR